MEQDLQMITNLLEKVADVGVTVVSEDIQFALLGVGGPEEVGVFETTL